MVFRIVPGQGSSTRIDTQTLYSQLHCREPEGNSGSVKSLPSPLGWLLLSAPPGMCSWKAEMNALQQSFSKGWACYSKRENHTNSGGGHRMKLRVHRMKLRVHCEVWRIRFGKGLCWGKKETVSPPPPTIALLHPDYCLELCKVQTHQLELTPWPLLSLQALKRQSSLGLLFFNSILAHGDLRNHRLNQLSVSLWHLAQRHGCADPRIMVRCQAGVLGNCECAAGSDCLGPGVQQPRLPSTKAPGPKF